MTRWWAALAGVLAATGAMAQDRTRLEVYSTLEIENLNDFKKSFEAEKPRHRDPVEPRLDRHRHGEDPGRAGPAARRCDLGAGRHLDAAPRKKGLLEPYAPKNLAAIKPSFRDPANPPAWVGMEAWVAAVCFNTIEAQKLSLPKPQSWYDLLDPRFQGQAHHAASGIVGDGLLPRLGLDPDVRRGKGVGVHGQAAREHRGL